MEKPKLKYIMRKVVLDKQNIKKFYSDEEKRRMIREGKVNSLVSGLNRGVHFSSPIVVNKIGSRHSVIDGNHRHVAIQRKIDADPAFSIPVWTAEYKDLTKEEEREVFSLWNRGTKQTTDDWLKIHWDCIDLGDKLLKIPSSIYGAPNKIKTRLIMGAHLSAKKPGSFTGGYNADGPSVVTHASNLTAEDVKYMSAFVKDMTEIFGPFSSLETYWKSTAVQAFYKIWYDNLSNISRKKFIKTMKSVFMGPGQNTYRTLAKSSGRAACAAFYTAATHALNTKKGINLIIPTNGA